MALRILLKNVNRGRYLDVPSSLSYRSTYFYMPADEDSPKRGKPYKRIPKIPTFPLIGSAWAYLPFIGKYSVEKMHRADINKHMVYGDMVREKIGRFEVVNCYHPEAMLTIIEEDKNDETPFRGDFATLKAYRNMRKDWYIHGGLLTTEGSMWKDLRHDIEKCTSRPGFLENYIEPMNDIATDFVNLILGVRDKTGEMENIISYLNKWALEAIAVVTLNDRLGCLEQNLDSTSFTMELIKSIEIQLECMNKLEASAGNIPLWKYFPTPTWLKFVKAADTFTALAFKNLAISAFVPLDGEIRLPLFQHLMESWDVPSAMVLMTDLMMAGIDTTSNTAGFLLYELAKNPEKQEAAVKELNTLLPAKEDKLTFEKYNELKYLRNCLKESMRLHPIVRGNIRIFKNDVVICDYKIPAGTAVICVLQVVYKSPRYFDYPNRFQPERWDDEKKYPFFHPFGYGARNCVGNTLAELEILTMVTEVLRNFRLEYHYEDIDMTTRLINTPDRPIKLRLLER